MHTLILVSAVIAMLATASALTRRIAQDPDSTLHPDHPWAFCLGLGIYAFSLGLPVALSLAHQYGFGYLAYFLGASGLLMLAPMVLYPLFKIIRGYQLFSLADLLTFRYRSQISGTLIAMISWMAMSLLMAAILRHLIRIGQQIDSSVHPTLLMIAMLIICAAIIVVTFRESWRGANPTLPFITLSAIFGLFMMAGILILGAYLLFGIFGGVFDLDSWITQHGQRISSVDRHLEAGPWRALLLIFFSAPLVFPPFFHLIFCENRRTNSLFKATWGFPLYLLLFSLPIPVILWASIRLAVPAQADELVIGLLLTLHHPMIAGFSTVMMIAAGLLLLALCCTSQASTIFNHILLLWQGAGMAGNLYAWLERRRIIILLVTLLTPAFLMPLLPDALDTSSVVILAFSLLLQVFPGVLALLYWPQGNRYGFLCGLLAGTATWALLLFLPSILSSNITEPLQQVLGALASDPRENWHTQILIALFANVACFTLVSLLTQADSEESAAAQACTIDAISNRPYTDIAVSNANDFVEKLKPLLGTAAAGREVNRALEQLDLKRDEHRVLALKRLRNQLEANLSGLLGPGMARSILKRSIDDPYSGTPRRSDIHFLEAHLEDYHSRLSGLAAELDQLRRYHRQVLQQLPVAACSLGADQTIMMWNQAMEDLTEISEADIVGAHLPLIPQPWHTLLSDMVHDSSTHILKRRLDLNGQTLFFNLHKALLDDGMEGATGQVILIEDMTENQRLEAELIHSERLASIGRLAAGVAHEVGNPVTGIACLAQNLRLMTEDSEVLQTADQIVEQTRRINRILQTLMSFSRKEYHAKPGIKERVALRRCVEDAIRLLQLAPDAAAVLFHNHCSEQAIVQGDSQRLIQVFVNLLKNARDASENGQPIWIRTELSDDSIRLQVIDEGSGITEDQKDRLFEPFFTTKGPDRGTGLGLALVYGIIEEHTGRIQIVSPAPGTDKGTAVIIDFPRAQPGDQQQTTVTQV